MRDLSKDKNEVKRISWLRTMMIKELENRPEGFSDGKRLIPGREYPPVIGSCL
jgi:hypothetical protein